MTEHPAVHPPRERRTAPVVHPATQLSGADYEALRRELDGLRSRHRVELEERLRDARTSGSPGDDDDMLAVLEEAAIAEARIKRLEALLQSASVVDGTGEVDGRAGLGCTVSIVDQKGRTADYVLVGRRNHGSRPNEVSTASPVGIALLGSRPGDVVDVALPNGRRRSLEIVDVQMPSADRRATKAA